MTGNTARIQEQRSEREADSLERPITATERLVLPDSIARSTLPLVTAPPAIIIHHSPYKIRHLWAPFVHPSTHHPSRRAQ